ncbi:MAG TPA: alpha/beta hydrolase [Chryseolinea sp.]
MSYVKISDKQSAKRVELYYEDWGHGQPIVLIHGWPLSHEMWEYQISDLVDAGFRVIAYDRRGFGKSSKPYDGYDYDTLSDDLKALLDDLDLQDVTLVGFSMGGGEVVRYFSRHGGDRVSKAVLIGSVTPCMLKSDDNPNGVNGSVFEEMMNGIREDRINFLDSFGKLFFGVNLVNKPISGPLLEYFRMLAAVASPRATIECVRSFAYTEFYHDMRAINVPTLIIHGDADKTVPIEPTGNHSAKLIPDSQYIIYEGAPHGLFYTDRERLNKDLIQFIRESVSEGVH